MKTLRNGSAIQGGFCPTGRGGFTSCLLPSTSLCRYYVLFKRLTMDRDSLKSHSIIEVSYHGLSGGSKYDEQLRAICCNTSPSCWLDSVHGNDR